LPNFEVVEVEFENRSGQWLRRNLLVDTGFCGLSSVILGFDSVNCAAASYQLAHAEGALQGPQVRAWVTCRVIDAGFHSTVIAIIADLKPLALPDGVEGMIGLNFLRLFNRWGSEKLAGDRRFFLES
jgi:hypothetical protein